VKRLFFDTWGWVAIAHKNDNHHKAVFEFYKSFLSNKGIPVATDYILAETITILRARTDSNGVKIFIDTLLEAHASEKIIFERIDEKRWNKAWEFAKKYSDKPYISFVDFTSIVVMKEINIKDILTGDKHFEDIGLNFRKLF
jgi:predicted nucleic acid-binding protein